MAEDGELTIWIEGEPKSRTTVKTESTKTSDSGIGPALIAAFVAIGAAIGWIGKSIADGFKGKELISLDPTNEATLQIPNMVEDAITVANALGQQGQLTITLDTGPAVFWFKAVEVRDWRHDVRAGAYVTEHNGPSTCSLPNDQLPGCYIQFVKAKMWGIHTGMYELRGLEAFADRHLTFVWERD